MDLHGSINSYWVQPSVPRANLTYRGKLLSCLIKSVEGCDCYPIYLYKGPCCWGVHKSIVQGSTRFVM